MKISPLIPACAILAVMVLVVTVGFRIKSTAAVMPETEQLEDTLSGDGASLGQPVFIRIFKQSNELEVWLKGGETFDLYKTYEICHYSGSLGPKLIEGDNQSPEGFYQVARSQLNPDSNYHLAFNIGFPNEYDQAHGRTGSFIMVHGDCVSVGCYAMTDDRIEEIYAIAEAALSNGQASFQVHIFPFRMEDSTLESVSDSRWYALWQNLKTGYDYFEESRIPPLVSLENKAYAFSSP